MSAQIHETEAADLPAGVAFAMYAAAGLIAGLFFVMVACAVALAVTL